MSNARHILFYDGHCLLCDRLIRFIFTKTPSNLAFSPLQSSHALSLLPSEYIQSINTIVLLKDKKTYTSSSAIIEVLGMIKGFGFISKLLYLIPRFLRDSFYTFIAKNRIKWFGELNNCRIYSKSEKERFLI